MEQGWTKVGAWFEQGWNRVGTMVGKWLVPSQNKFLNASNIKKYIGTQQELVVAHSSYSSSCYSSSSQSFSSYHVALASYLGDSYQVALAFQRYLCHCTAGPLRLSCHQGAQPRSGRSSPWSILCYCWTMAQQFLSTFHGREVLAYKQCIPYNSSHKDLLVFCLRCCSLCWTANRIPMTYKYKPCWHMPIDPTNIYNSSRVFYVSRQARVRSLHLA